jgi:hypothetical protein
MMVMIAEIKTSEEIKNLILITSKGMELSEFINQSRLSESRF